MEIKEAQVPSKDEDMNRSLTNIAKRVLISVNAQLQGSLFSTGGLTSLQDELSQSWSRRPVRIALRLVCGKKVLSDT
jgi:hypothetical protein